MSLPVALLVSHARPVIDMVRGVFDTIGIVGVIFLRLGAT